MAPDRPARLALRPNSLFAAVTAAACALAVGCNSLLENADHPLATDDGSTAISSLDAGAIDGPASSPVGAFDASPATDGPPGDLPSDAEGPSDAGTGTEKEAGDASSSPPILYVQVASKDSKDSVSTVSATYSDPQQSGDLNVVVIGWGDATHAITTVSDTTGNSYVLATTPVATTGAALAIYYAPHVSASGGNTVTVDFDQPDYPCVAILEYAGVGQIDQTAMGMGSSDSASTAAVTTALPSELVVGAGQPDQSGTANFVSAGAGFDERAITGISGMLTEDMITTEVGTFEATGALSKSSSWVMQVVTFK